MAEMQVAVRWERAGLRFRGGKVGGPEMLIDSDGEAGPSPTVALAVACAGCMAVDVLEIAQKMRLPITGLEVLVDATRRDEPPRRFTALRQRFVVQGVAGADEPKLRRAIDLSREKYCSVLHSLREDIEMSFDLELQ